jgi:hypothetical protein
MSHIQTIELEIKNLTALKLTCKRLGLVWKQDQKTFTWYGRTPEKCDHAIQVPNAKYEIGVLKNGDRKGYTLQVDYYDRAVTQQIGQLGGLFKQAYTLEVGKAEAIKKGYSVREHKLDNKIQLHISVGV